MAVTKKAILMESKKVLKEDANLKLGPDDLKKLDEICKLAKEIGLVTVEDLTTFLNNEAEPGDTIYTALKCYRDALGAEFQGVLEEALKRINEVADEPAAKEPLNEDKGYISKEDAEDDFTRINHYLSVSGYSEIPYTLYDEIAVAAADDEDAENAKLRKSKLGYIGTTTDGLVTVTAATSENLNKARELAADFDCPIESEITNTDRVTKQKTYTIVINPYCGYEYGTEECAAAMDKYTSEGQKNAYGKKDNEESTIANADEDEEETEETPVEESVKCTECGKACAKEDCKEEIDLGCICKECISKRVKLGESLTFIKKLN